MTGRLLQMSGVVADLVYPVARLPEAGQDVEALSVTITAGGGFNAMAAARRCGIDVTYGGSLGAGLFADIVSRMMLAEGIALASSRRCATDQGNCVVLVDATGERTFISHYGAERQIDPLDLEAIGVAAYDWILLTGYSLYKLESARALVPWLRSLARGPCLLFDPGTMVGEIPAEYLAAMMTRADWVSANAAEAEVMTGSGDPAEAALTLAKGRAGAIVRVGAEGCWLSQWGAVVKIEGFAVPAIDTNGAGDTHDGAFIAACCRGFTPMDAANFANAAAALSTTRRGPATAPMFDEVQAFLKTYTRRA